jgi:hypothetical protein
MPYLYGANVLTNSGNRAGRGGGRNRPPQGVHGVDADVQQALRKINIHGNLVPRGECSGITSSWIIAFLNGLDDAEKNIYKFPSFFVNVLQFQGAYMKMIHGKAERHINRYAERGFVGRIQKDSTKIGGHLRAFQLPKRNWWAAYWSCVGHAIGLGKYRGGYYIMEPNAGLFVYSDQNIFLDDVNELADARYTHKNVAIPTSTFYFYIRG